MWIWALSKCRYITDDAMSTTHQWKCPGGTSFYVYNTPMKVSWWHLLCLQHTNESVLVAPPSMSTTHNESVLVAPPISRTHQWKCPGGTSFCVCDTPMKVSWWHLLLCLRHTNESVLVAPPSMSTTHQWKCPGGTSFYVYNTQWKCPGGTSYI